MPTYVRTYVHASDGVAYSPVGLPSHADCLSGSAVYAVSGCGPSDGKRCPLESSPGVADSLRCVADSLNPRHRNTYANGTRLKEPTRADIAQLLVPTRA